MADSPTQDAERWRAKYYDQLEVLERREKEWHLVEELLRQGLLRVSLAVEPGDAALDRPLHDLRNALRHGAESATLSRHVEAIATEVTRLERERKAHGTADGDRAAPVRALLAQLIRQVLPAGSEQEAKLLLGRVAHANAGELARIGEELAATLKALRSHDAPPLHTVLVQLLEYLSIPAELNEEVEAIKSLLAAPLAEPQVDGVLRRMAELVASVRRAIVREKRELEGFLRQLTENLKELDQNLHLAVVEQLQSLSEGRKLGVTMDEQMVGLAASVESANELDALKGAIQQRVLTIRTHMEAYRKAEEQRSARAERSVAALTSRLNELESETAQLRERIQAEHRQALVDPLTGISNRLAYDERLDQEYQRWRRYRSPLTLTVWDVDRFKAINDRFGHQAGDKVLKVVAKLLGAQVRTTDFLCRYGGEEFVIILPETALAQALAVAEKLRASVEAADFHYRGEAVKITISCGLAEFGGDDTPDEVFGRADQALYVAKAQGRNCCRSA